jgi:hypothetical protein
MAFGDVMRCAKTWRKKARTYKIKSRVISFILTLSEEALLHGILEVVIQFRFSRGGHHGRVIRSTHAEVKQEDDYGRDEKDGSGRTLAQIHWVEDEYGKRLGSRAGIEGMIYMGMPKPKILVLD